MNNPHPSRRDFLKASMLAGMGASLAKVTGGCASNRPTIAAATNPGILSADYSSTRPRPAGQKPVHNLTTQPTEKVRVAVIGLHRGMAHVNNCLGIEFAEITAVCDIVDDRAKAAADACEKKSGKRPAVYSGNENIWEDMVARDDIDAVYIATPWRWHVPMALRTMEHGKHAFIEVPAAITVDDCWRLVDASERLQRHCVILENCCYGENELLILNLVRQGVFGQLTHAECGYLHDLRSLLFTYDGEGDWRRNYHTLYNGNLYPTHGLGPIAEYLGIGRGDQFKFLVSTSSPEMSLTHYRDEHNPNNGSQAGEKYICGDVNTSLIKTELGRTIMLQHDTVSPRPYSRINALYGTGAVFFDYPARLSVDHPKEFGLDASNSEDWLSDKDLQTMREKFTHPLWKKLAERAKGGGHGGMDFVLSWRLLDCLRRGVTPDSVVYDAAAWSSIVETSVQSVAHGSAPVNIPDFTRGLWKTMPPLAIAES